MKYVTLKLDFFLQKKSLKCYECEDCRNKMNAFTRHCEQSYGPPTNDVLHLFCVFFSLLLLFTKYQHKYRRGGCVILLCVDMCVCEAEEHVENTERNSSTPL